MKILIMSRPRCRTSFLCEATSNFYNIPNFHEDFDYIVNKYNTDYARYILLKKNPTLQELNQNLKLHINKVNLKLEENGGVIKFFPRYLLAYFFNNKKKHISIDNFDEFHYFCETNITSLFNFKMYDQIIFLERNLVDSAISYIYSLQTKQLLFNDKNIVDYLSRKNERIDIRAEMFPTLDFFIFEFYIYEQLKTFISQKYKTCTFLTYENCTEYVSNNYKNEKNIKLIDPRYNYSDKIKNYEQLKSYITETGLKYSQITPAFNFN